MIPSKRAIGNIRAQFKSYYNVYDYDGLCGREYSIYLEKNLGMVRIVSADCWHIVEEDDRRKISKPGEFPECVQCLCNIAGELRKWQRDRLCE